MTTTYRNSLNLPKTDFPMKAALPKREPLLLEKWKQYNLYEQLRQIRQGKPKYILHDGPPYANGHLHIGHALNKILKDIVIKSKNLSGLDAPFVPGWDCHGLPIELKVEKQFKAAKKTYTPAEFRKACRQYATEQIQIQKEEFKRLGILADWERPYLTMDFQVEADIIRALGACIAAGHISAGLKPVHWCVACESALAELEVSYQDKHSMAIEVKFEVVKGACLDALPGQGALFLPIWTTTPWTLPANEAIAVGPEIEYCLIQLPDERLLLAKSLYQERLAHYANQNDYSLLGSYCGKILAGSHLQHPFESRVVPLIMSDHVVTDKGTGAVHIAPSHGPEDYVLGLEHQLPLRNLVDAKGRYCLDNTELNQQSVLKADPLIVDILQRHNALLSQETVTHSYPYCSRHQTPLIFRATPQWFLKLQDASLYQQFNKALTTVHWVPEWGQARMGAMLGDSVKTARPDWCLSRQRYWGVPLPFFIHKQTGQYHPKTLVWIENIAQQVEKEGVEAWYTLQPEALLGANARDYYKLTDVLDVWFDSGMTHHAILKKDARLQWPADLYLEGSDQFRGWFQSSLITGIVLDGKAPYRTILMHGFTVNAEGEKMSKSVGGTLPLDTILEQWGADIVRLWIASTDTCRDMHTSDETFQRTAEAYRRIRNTLRFLLANLHDFKPEEHAVAPEQLISLDRWVLARAMTLQKTIQTAYAQFNFPIVYQSIHHFCMHELGSIYLSILKDRQYTMQPNSLGRRSGQTALYHIAEAMLRWLAPILSFTAEEAWQYLPGSRVDSVFLTEWYPLSVEETTDPLAAFYQEANGCENCWDYILTVRETVNQAIEVARNQGLIGSALEANLILYCKPGLFLTRLLILLQQELHFIFLTSSVKVVPSDTKLLNEKGIAIEILPVEDAQLKCARCWHRRHEVGQNAEHPALCGRCIQNLPHAAGESRDYA